MADIDVVPKRRTHTWLWIILAVIIVLLVMAMMGVFSRNTTNPVGLMTPQTAAPLLAPSGTA